MMHCCFTAAQNGQTHRTHKVSGCLRSALVCMSLYFSSSSTGTMLFPTVTFWTLNALLLLVDTTGKPAFITRYRIQLDKNNPVCETCHDMTDVYYVSLSHCEEVLICFHKLFYFFCLILLWQPLLLVSLLVVLQLSVPPFLPALFSSWLDFLAHK